MSQTRNFRGGLPYHIYNRGNKKEDIFLDLNDYAYFNDKLYEYARRFKVTVAAYCPMPNHYHMLVIPELETSIPDMMQNLGIAYHYYWRKKYKIQGHIFQSRYKSKLICDIPYLNTVTGYIRNNPVEAGIVANFKDYKLAYYDENIIKILPHIFKVIK